MTRKTKQFIWVEADDCLPPHRLDLTSEHDAGKVEGLYQQFKKSGFDLNKPALVGYPLNNSIQLVSGTHRHLAAKRAGIKLPVTLWLRSDIEKMWGTELWKKVIEDIPVVELEEAEVENGFKVPPYERVELRGVSSVG